ncbi:MAG: DUF4231 domain-containing protein [Pyrinomonadaceae bacterium]
MADNEIKKQTITFQNGNEAVAVFPPAHSKAEAIIAALGVGSYDAVILVLGGAASVDDKLIPRLTQLFGRGIARAAAEANALIIDGGTQAGVMAMIGEGVAGRGAKSKLVGVAPAGLIVLPNATGTGVQLEPNHTHFVLVAGKDWGSETPTLYNLVSTLTDKKPGAPTAGSQPGQPEAEKAASKLPAVAILAGGGPIAKNEVLRAVRQGLTLIVVEGSGGLADELAAAWKQKDPLPDDPVMAEIIADGEIHLHLLSNPVKGIERLIIRELGIDNVLMQAWEIFADYDLNATIQQKRFRRLQLTTLFIGLLGTALAIIQQVYAPKDTGGNLLSFTWPKDWIVKDAPPVDLFSLTPNVNGHRPLIWWTLHYVLILVPIVLTVLVTALNRFKQGSKWLLLRAGAESIKREIYRYRARAMNYKELPEQQLAARVEDVTRRTMRTDVNQSALVPYQKEQGFPPDMDAAAGGDDGFSYLTPDRYVEVRLGDQLRYFRKRAGEEEQLLRWLYWLTFIIGGVGAFLAAIDRQAWIALTTAMVAAIGTYLGYRQTENTLTKYNQAATDLANVKSWWNALSADDQALPVNIDSLVEHTEQVLQSELDGWVQQMQNALAELRKGQEPKPESEGEENQEPHEDEQKPKAGANQTNGQGNVVAPPPAQTNGEQPPGGAEGAAVQPKPNETQAQPGGSAADDAAETDQADNEDDGTDTNPAAPPAPLAPTDPTVPAEGQDTNK